VDLFFPRRGGLDGFGFVDFVATSTVVFVIVVVLDVEPGFVEGSPTNC